MNHNQPKYYNGNINGNNNGHISHNGNNGSAVQRERYQHPALTAIINESQGMKFRGEFFYDEFLDILVVSNSKSVDCSL